MVCGWSGRERAPAALRPLSAPGCDLSTEKHKKREGAKKREINLAGLSRVWENGAAMSDAVQPPDEISVAQAARLAGVTADTIRSWARDPEHPCPHLREYGPQRKRLDRVAFEAWLRSVREGAHAKPGAEEGAA